jgi:hypothetical protein
MSGERSMMGQPVSRDAMGWTDIIGKLQSRQHIASGEAVEIRPTVCNIEGDRPGYNAMKMNTQIRWGNIVFALDSPFSTQCKVHLTFAELLSEQIKNNYKYLEASIPDFDQLKVLLQQLTWISYYIDLYTQNIMAEKIPQITIQVHQRANETDQLNNFIKYLPCFYQNFKCLSNDENYKTAFVATNNGSVNLHFKYGYDIDEDLNNANYRATQVPVPGSDAYLSFSMSIGYDPSIAPSDAIYPDTFFCLDTQTNTLQDYPAYRNEPDTRITNDFITQFKTANFEVKFNELANKWIDILAQEKFEPEGKGVIRHDKIDVSLLCKFRIGAVGKLVGLWNPDPKGDYPIKSWKV